MLRGSRSDSTSWAVRGFARVAVGVAALALAATACGSSSAKSSSPTSTSPAAPGVSSGSGTVTFLNWADAESNTHPVIQKMIAQFESLYPNIKIVSQPVSYSNIAHQALLQAKSGNAPDVAEMQGNYTFQLAAAGVLEPLDQFASSSYQSAIIPQELALGKANGQLDAIPWTVGPFGMWYNKTVMAQVGISSPPTTLDQLLSDLAIVKAKDPSAIPLGTDTTNRTYGLDQNWSFMQTDGATPFNASSASVNTPGMIQYLTFMQTLGKDGYTLVNHLGGYFRTPAAHNQVAFDIDGPYLEGVVTSDTHESPAQFEKDWGLTTIPTGTTGKAFSVPTDHQLVMFKSAKNKQAAWTFMNWLTTSDYAVTNYTIPAEKSLPPLSSLGTNAQALEQSNSFYQIYLKKIIPAVVRPPWGTAYTNAYTPVMTGIQQVMTSSTSPASEAKSIQSSLSSALANGG